MSAIEAAERIVAHFKNRNPIGGMEAHALTVARALLAAQPSADDVETARKIAHVATPRCSGGAPAGNDGTRWHSQTCDTLTDQIAAALASRAAAERARVIAIFAPFLDRLPADAKAEAMAMMDRLTKEERK